MRFDHGRRPHPEPARIAATGDLVILGHPAEIAQLDALEDDSLFAEAARSAPPRRPRRRRRHRPCHRDRSRRRLELRHRRRRMVAAVSGGTLLGERSYYLDEFTDEIMPCMPTLAAWADWLSRPDPEWRPDAAAADGTRYAATVLRWEEDVVVRRDGDGWAFSRDVPDAALVAVRFGQGLGWDSENIIGGRIGDDITTSLRSWLKENDEYLEDVEYVAIGMAEPDVVLVYRAGPPPALILAPIAAQAGHA